MTLYIIAGANGSGKTTFAKTFSNLNNLEFINADEIAKEFDKNDIYKYKIKAGKEFFQRLQKHLNQNNSFVIETTLSGKYLIKVIKIAKNSGFKINLIYLFLESPIENLFRVQNRVLNGGHNVPKEDIFRRFYRSKKLFWDLYKSLVDEWSLFFNGDDNFEEIANNQKILDEFLLNKFLKDINGN